MFVWLLYDKPWTLPAGGAVVGYITNWLAIKLIFEPVDPVRIGPFVLQGLFLKRQDEVRERGATLPAPASRYAEPRRGAAALATMCFSVVCAPFFLLSVHFQSM